MNTWKNQLYFGDNLEILRGQHIPAGSVDLIYLDPPFNSNATYNVLFAEKSGEKSAAQITAFEDTWQWGEEAEGAYRDAVTCCEPDGAGVPARLFCSTRRTSCLSVSGWLFWSCWLWQCNRVLELIAPRFTGYGSWFPTTWRFKRQAKKSHPWEETRRDT